MSIKLTIVGRLNFIDETLSGRSAKGKAWRKRELRLAVKQRDKSEIAIRCYLWDDLVFFGDSLRRGDFLKIGGRGYLSSRGNLSLDVDDIAAWTDDKWLIIYERPQTNDDAPAKD